MKTCSIEGCERPYSGKGLCKKHYDALPENKVKAKQREQAPHRKKQRSEARALPDRKIYRRNWQLANDYGISIEQFNEMLASQNGCCAICKEFMKRPHLDHDHMTGKIRGLLCKRCNQGIGFLRDNIKILNNAIEYLEKSQ